MPNLLTRAAQYLFGGYDAVDSKNRRKQATGVLRSADDEANSAERGKLQSGGRDLRRNFTIAAWMVRRHLDYVTGFTHQATTPNKALNRQLEEIVKEGSKPENYDVRGRHGLRPALRIAEAARTVEGDILNVRLNDGRTQWIEADRIRDAPGLPASIDRLDLVHGVQIDKAGGTKAYCVSRRGTSGRGGSSGAFTFERMVPAANAYLHGYFERFDQVRGVAPLTTALNELRDAYEGLDYARAKMKVAQLFAFAIFREPNDGNPKPRNNLIDFGTGPQFLDLDKGDDAKFLESSVQSAELRSFMEIVIQIALKSLDLPYSFYSEDFTNYAGSRGALQGYERACESKQDDNRAYLDWWTNWKVNLAIRDGLLPGADLAALRWQWHARAMPWIDPLKEILALKEAIGMGVDTRTRYLRAMGLDFEDVAEELAREAKILRDANLPLNLDSNNALIQALTTDAPPAKQHAA